MNRWPDWAIRAVEFVITLILIVAIFAVLLAPNADAASLVIVDEENGNVIVKCVLPADYYPTERTVICLRDTRIFLSGFE